MSDSVDISVSSVSSNPSPDVDGAVPLSSRPIPKKVVGGGSKNQNDMNHHQREPTLFSTLTRVFSGTVRVCGTILTYCEKKKQYYVLYDDSYWATISHTSATNQVALYNKHKKSNDTFKLISGPLIYHDLMKADDLTLWSFSNFQARDPHWLTLRMDDFKGWKVATEKHGVVRIKEVHLSDTAPNFRHKYFEFIGETVDGQNIMWNFDGMIKARLYYIEHFECDRFTPELACIAFQEAQKKHKKTTSTNKNTAKTKQNISRSATKSQLPLNPKKGQQEANVDQRQACDHCKQVVPKELLSDDGRCENCFLRGEDGAQDENISKEQQHSPPLDPKKEHPKQHHTPPKQAKAKASKKGKTTTQAERQSARVAKLKEQQQEDLKDKFKEVEDQQKKIADGWKQLEKEKHDLKQKQLTLEKKAAMATSSTNSTRRTNTRQTNTRQTNARRTTRTRRTNVHERLFPCRNQRKPELWKDVRLIHVDGDLPEGKRKWTNQDAVGAYCLVCNEVIDDFVSTRKPAPIERHIKICRGKNSSNTLVPTAADQVPPNSTLPTAANQVPPNTNTLPVAAPHQVPPPNTLPMAAPYQVPPDALPTAPTAVPIATATFPPAHQMHLTTAVAASGLAMAPAQLPPAPYYHHNLAGPPAVQYHHRPYEQPGMPPPPPPQEPPEPYYGQQRALPPEPYYEQQRAPPPPSFLGRQQHQQHGGSNHYYYDQPHNDPNTHRYPPGWGARYPRNDYRYG